MLRCTLLSMIFVLFSTLVRAAKPPLNFQKINTQNGLSNNTVNCIVQDKRGFMWMGTNDGLNRFDGNNFITFRNKPGDTTSISGNIITALLEDENAVIWIATADGGITRYDYRLAPSKQFKQYKHQPNDTLSIPVNAVNDLLEDSYGFLWLATSGKFVLRFNKKTGYFETPVRKGTRNVLDLCLDKKGVLWAGRQGGGILKINTQTLAYEMEERYNNLYAKLPHATVSALFKDKADNMWFGSWDKLLYRQNAATNNEEVFAKSIVQNSFPNDEIHAFAQDASGRIWMGGKYFGLTLYDTIQKQFYNYQNDFLKDGSIADNNINCIFVSNAGLVWIGTSKGISIYNPAQQPFIQTFLSEEKKDVTIYDFYSDERNNLWIGTSNGLYVQEAGSSILKHRPLAYKNIPLTISKFFKDEDGAFYLGTNFSLFKYDLNKGDLSLLPNTEKDSVMYNIIDSRIVSIIKDSIGGHPALLVSPYGHYLAYYDFTENKWVSRLDTSKNIIRQFNLQDNLLRKLYKTKAGNIWLATGKYGLGEWKKYPAPYVNYFQNNPMGNQTISNNNIYDIAEDATGNLWISTYGGGLNYFNTTTKKSTHIGVTNNLLEGLQVDVNRQVWMISNGQLDKYDPRLKTNTIFTLPDLEKSGGVSRDIYRDNESNFYVAGNNYFIKFRPENIRTVAKQPKVYFTDFKIFNTSYSQLLYNNKEVQLLYNQNYFTIEFAAPEFSADQPEYAYMLEGFDKEWIELGQRNFANFSNLGGGTYIFKVKATDRKGSWSTNFAILQIVIVPPFWERWWFFALSAFFIIALIYAFYRYRIDELIKRQAIRNKIAQDLHDSVGSTLSSVSVYSQVAKIQQSKGNLDELKNVIEKIANTSTEMISEMNDIVWAINPRNDSMEKILERMQSFAQPLLQTQHIAFSFKYDPHLLHINLSMEKRKNFYLIFKEAINNALKYSGASNLKVNIKVQHHQVELSATDDGIGLGTAQITKHAERSLSGNGLYNMKRRALEMKGLCIIDSSPERGTTVFLKFPIT